MFLSRRGIAGKQLAFGLCLLVQAGCAEMFAGFQMGASSQRKQSRTGEGPPVSVASTVAAAPAPVESESKDVSGQERDRIQQFLDRFPEDDLTAKVDRPSQAEGSLPTVEEGSAASAQQPSGRERSATGRNSAAAPATQPARAQSAAAAPKPTTQPVAAVPAPASGTPEAKPPAGGKSGSNQPASLKEQAVAESAGARKPEKPVLGRVRVGPVEPVKKPEPAPVASTNNPATTQPAHAAKMSLPELIADLEKKVAEHPNELADQFKLRLLLAADGQTSKAIAPTSGMNQETSDVVSALFQVITNARAVAEDPVAGADQTMKSLDQLRRIVRNYAQLKIPKVVFCKRVDSFGVYEPFKPPVFIAGTPRQQAIVYCEVKDFTNQETADGQFKTSLSQRLEILTPSSRSEWSVEEPAIVDVSRNPREDFFLTQLIELPSNLAAGKYILKVTIEDRLSNRAQEEFLEFAVQPQSLAGSTTVQHQETP